LLFRLDNPALSNDLLIGMLAWFGKPPLVVLVTVEVFFDLIVFVEELVEQGVMVVEMMVAASYEVVVVVVEKWELQSSRI
jgi:hypothetical protein